MLGQICRICGLSDHLKMISKIESCDMVSVLCDAGLSEVKEDDRLPHRMCLPCASALKEFHQFRTLYEKTYAKFKMTIYQLQRKKPPESASVLDPAVKDSNKIVNEFQLGCRYRSDEEFLDSHSLGYKQAGDKECDKKDEDSKYHEVVVKEDFASWDDDEKQQLQSNKENPTDAENERFSIPEQTNKMFEQLKESRKDTEPDSYSHLNKCDVCGKSFASAQILKEHDAVHLNHNSDDSELAKKSCGFPQDTTHQGIDDAKSLLNENAVNSNEYKCEVCNKSFRAKRGLRAHIALHANPGKYKCKECGKSFTKTQCLKEHVALHSNPDLFKCDICGKSFSSAARYTDHKIVHTNPDLLKCKECGKSFARVFLLKEHIALHSKSYLFKCDVCGKSFKSATGYKDHKNMHSNPTKLTCEICNKSFVSSNTFHSHKAVHTNPDLFKCKECGKSFTTTRNLKEHIALHSNPDLFKCDICGKSFKSSSKYNDHKNAHLNPTKSTCEICNKTFASSSTLKAHRVLHTNQDLFKCVECGKTFSTVHNLKKHRARHSNADLHLGVFSCHAREKSGNNNRQI